MKIRTGFVSNSSSSSFTCDICSRTDSGWDASSDELGFVECTHGHTFCDEHSLKKPKRNEDGYVSSKCCPICNFMSISNEDVGIYLEKEYNIPRKEAFDEIKKVNGRRQKLYDFEYVKYVFKKVMLTEDALLSQIKLRFGTYKKFEEYIR